MSPEAREIIDSIQKTMADIQYRLTGVSPIEWKLANAIACLCDVLKHEAKSEASVLDE